MLLNIDHVLSGELLHVLDDMGHTDRLLIADANVPLLRFSCPVVRLGEIRVARALSAILSVFPLDEPLDAAVTRMPAKGDAERLNASQADCLDVLREQVSPDFSYRVPALEDFYAEAFSVSAVVHVLEPVPASSLILTKGVVYPDWS